MLMKPISKSPYNPTHAANVIHADWCKFSCKIFNTHYVQLLTYVKTQS